MEDILKVINKEIDDYASKIISVVPGFHYNQKATIEQIIFYHNSKFTTGAIDDDGDRKYFYNINRNPCKIFTKAVDFDTKSVHLLTADGGDPIKTWYMERDLKYWMRDKQFGKVLNRIFNDLPIFGSVVIKIVDGTPYFVDLRNFVVEQGADSLPESNYIIEIHPMTPYEFRKTAKKMGWADEKVKETIDEFHKMRDTSHIRVFERYGEVMKGDGTYSYQRIFHADVGVDTVDEYQKRINHKGVLLSAEDWTVEQVEDMYWEFHKDKIPGRWLGFGVVEELFEPQIKQNEIANLQSKAAYWNALRLWQTHDQAFNRNLATDVKNGTVLTVDSDITQVDMSDRNLAFFNEETQKWKENVQDLTIAFTPVGHSVIAIQIAQDQVVSYFHQIQQDIALQVKEMIFRVIIPQFQKENYTEHTLRIVGKDLDHYIEMIKGDMVMKEVVRQAVMNKLPSNEERDAIGVAIEETIKSGKEKHLTIPKGYFTNTKYDVDIDITGESVDVKARYAARLALLQAITADPTMTTDPIKKNFLYGLAEDGGLNAVDLFDVGTQPSAIEQASNFAPQNVRAGGGVSGQGPGNPLASKPTVTV